MTSTRRRGYTLLEILLVMAVVVALAALVVPSFQPMYRQYRVAAAADTVKAGMLQARAQAVEEGRPYVFGVLYGKGNFRVAPQGQSYWSNAGMPQQDENGQKPYVYESALPSDIVFSEKPGDAAPTDADTALDPKDVNPGQYKQLVVFLPDGTARQNVEVTLSKDQAVPTVVRLRGLTGEVTIRRANDDQNGDR
jgi:type II secretion system protein H